MFNVIDSQAYEDLIRMLFDLYAGAFLNLDKLFSSILKNPFDDFSSFVLNLNSELFEGKADAQLPEEVLFSKTCFKKSEMACPTQKNVKNLQNHAQSEVHADSQDLLKFDFHPEPGLLLVHKFHSIFTGSTNSLKKFLDLNSSIFTFVDGAKSRKNRQETRARKVIQYHTPCNFKAKLHRTVTNSANFEDVILNCGGAAEHPPIKKKISKEKGQPKFRDNLEMKLKKKREQFLAKPLLNY